MRTLSIAISELDYKNLGLKADYLSYADFMDVVRRTFLRRTLAECVQLANKNGLGELTMDEINAEIQAVRDNATDNH